MVDLDAKIWPMLIERIPDGSLVVIEDAGHRTWIDKPGEFEAALEVALRRSTGP